MNPSESPETNTSSSATDPAPSVLTLLPLRIWTFIPWVFDTQLQCSSTTHADLNAHFSVQDTYQF
jgi:hypothetical protein